MTTPVRVTSLRAENRTDSTAVATATPRLSWKSASTINDWRQASAELELTTPTGTVTATVTGRDSVLVDWPFESLEPRAIYSLRARVTGEDGSTSEWSEPTGIVAGFLADGEWVASMIQAGAPTEDKQPFVARAKFEVTGDVKRAYLVATAHGAYQASVNGSDVDDQILKPGWTSYQWHLVHEFTEVTALLTAGSNTIDLTVAGAWYTENFVGLAKPYYGATPAVAAQLMIDYADGSTQVVATDGSWTTSVTGPLVSASIYGGETYDATRVLTDWTSAVVDTEPFPTPVGRTAPAVRALDTAVLDDAQAAAAWGDAATVVPWVLYERFGNVGVLREQFESMTGWTDALVGYSGDRWLWEDMFQFGDWLDPDAPPERPQDAKADPDLISSAYFYRSADFTARAAAVLGETAAVEKYTGIAAKVREAFLREYVSESGRMMSDAQTAYAVAIQFGLYRDEQQKQAMGDRLAYLTRASAYRIGTGFVGTPLITDALTRTGHLPIATRLLTQTENPSWLYPVTMGATTIWERWDSMLEDGTINPGEMTSFNHYALGAVADWLHRTVAGLAPAAPGYRVLEISPLPLDGFDYANAQHETPYGLASSGWHREGASIVVDVTVPANSSARVILPGSADVIEVGSGTYTWTVDASTDTPEYTPIGDRTPLATIIDDPEAYEAIWTAIAKHDEEHSRNFRKHTKWTPGRVLDEAIFLMMMPKAVRSEITANLEALNASRRV
jgi:hypothetical protein